MQTLTASERERYSRQMLIENWGAAGQEKLKHSSVFIAGAGGLGSPVAMYLACAGVGHIKICDKDTVDLSNLNRQIIHKNTRIGKSKVDSAQKTMLEINDGIRVEGINIGIDSTNAAVLLGGAEIVVDCLDNLETRLILNREAALKNIPMVYGAIWGLEGRMTFIHSPETPCLGCIATKSDSMETFPAVGAVPGVIGSMQALEVIKYLTGTGETMKNKLIVWNGYHNQMRAFNVKKRRDCAYCSRGDVALPKNNLEIKVTDNAY
jgi:adenylyltransferase/sulfurtransferase